MGFLTALCLLANILVFALASNETIKAVTSISSRSGRKYNNVYQPPRQYGDDGDQKDDNDDSSDTNTGDGKSQQGINDDYPNYNSYKGYYQFNNYGPPSKYPQYAPNYKGYPFNAPYWKGSRPLDDSPSSMSPEKMMDMMLAINAMDADSKPDDLGLLSKLVTDPKSLAAAAIIPLSVVLAAVVPVLMNYMMTGASTPVVSTTATGTKEGRNIETTNNLGVILDNIARFARTMENGDCFQKTVCKVAFGDANVPGSDYIKKAAKTVVQLIKEDWANNLGVQDLVKGLRQGNCSDVCNGPKLTS